MNNKQLEKEIFTPIAKWRVETYITQVDGQRVISDKDAGDNIAVMKEWQTSLCDYELTTGDFARETQGFTSWKK